MKNPSLYLILTICVILLTSCNSENNQLKNRIKELELENKELKNDLKRKDYDKLVNADFILFPQTLSFKLNESNTISCYISERQTFPKFDVFLTDENYHFNDSDKIQLKNQVGNRFEFDYTPKSLKDDTVRIAAVFNLDTVKINLNGRAYLPVK